MLNTKKHKEIEKELEEHEQALHKFIVVRLFHGTLTLIRLNSDNKDEISIKEAPPTFPSYTFYIAGLTEEIQKEAMPILDKKQGHIRSYDEIENIIRYTIFEVAKRYPNKINNCVFIRRLSKRFDL